MRLKNADVYALISSHNKDSAYSQGNLVEVGSKNNLLSVFEHEIGHEKSKAIKLDEDKKLKQIYEYEKKLFTTNLPDIAVKQAGYFLRNVMANGLRETCAEANLIINAPQCWKDIGSRTMFLQRYFPRTIAYLADKYKDLS